MATSSGCGAVRSVVGTTRRDEPSLHGRLVGRARRVGRHRVGALWQVGRNVFLCFWFHDGYDLAPSRWVHSRVTLGTFTLGSQPCNFGRHTATREEQHLAHVRISIHSPSEDCILWKGREDRDETDQNRKQLASFSGILCDRASRRRDRLCFLSWKWGGSRERDGVAAAALRCLWAR